MASRLKSAGSSASGRCPPGAERGLDLGRSKPALDEAVVECRRRSKTEQYVNILVSAFHPAASDHGQMKAWLEGAVNGPEPVGVSTAVLSGALRVLTHPAIFDPPADTGDVLDVLDEFVGQDNVHVLSIPAGHWGVVSDLCRQVRAKGNVVHDAAHAALAIQHGATWISKDRGFARFPGLTWRLPE